MNNTDPESMAGKIILAVSAHPDDLEFGCAGTVAKWVEEGAIAYYCVVTDGCKGSEDHLRDGRELIETRKAEQRQAAEVLGVKEVFFLDFVDGELENTLAVRKEIVKIIRRIKPNIVITFDPSFIFDVALGFVNHPDHRIAGQATLDAVFPFARNARSFPELIDEGLSPHSVEQILLFNFSKYNFYVDITESIDLKVKALCQHRSQHDDTSWAIEWIRKHAEEVGEVISQKYAEGFLKIEVTG